MFLDLDLIRQLRLTPLDFVIWLDFVIDWSRLDRRDEAQGEKNKEQEVNLLDKMAALPSPITTVDIVASPIILYTLRVVFEVVVAVRVSLVDDGLVCLGRFVPPFSIPRRRHFTPFNSSAPRPRRVLTSPSASLASPSFSTLLNSGGYLPTSVPAAGMPNLAQEITYIYFPKPKLSDILLSKIQVYIPKVQRVRERDWIPDEYRTWRTSRPPQNSRCSVSSVPDPLINGRTTGRGDPINRTRNPGQSNEGEILKVSLVWCYNPLLGVKPPLLSSQSFLDAISSRVIVVTLCSGGHITPIAPRPLPKARPQAEGQPTEPNAYKMITAFIARAPRLEFLPSERQPLWSGA
ncbi:hypothetical protein C8J56DRAFT_1032926 [Mycena floridula]|nr:hypothetical protein C8J56DRAFT_1032926 [Mycena floridula]